MRSDRKNVKIKPLYFLFIISLPFLDIVMCKSYNITSWLNCEEFPTQCTSNSSIQCYLDHCVCPKHHPIKLSSFSPCLTYKGLDGVCIHSHQCKRQANIACYGENNFEFNNLSFLEEWFLDFQEKPDKYYDLPKKWGKCQCKLDSFKNIYIHVAKGNECQNYHSTLKEEETKYNSFILGSIAILIFVIPCFILLIANYNRCYLPPGFDRKIITRIDRRNRKIMKSQNRISKNKHRKYKNSRTFSGRSCHLVSEVSQEELINDQPTRVHIPIPIIIEISDSQNSSEETGNDLKSSASPSGSLPPYDIVCGSVKNDDLQLPTYKEAILLSEYKYKNEIYNIPE